MEKRKAKLPKEQRLPIKIPPSCGWENFDGTITIENTTANTLYVTIYEEPQDVE